MDLRNRLEELMQFRQEQQQQQPPASARTEEPHWAVTVAVVALMFVGVSAGFGAGWYVADRIRAALAGLLG